MNEIERTILNNLMRGGRTVMIDRAQIKIHELRDGRIECTVVDRTPGYFNYMPSQAEQLWLPGTRV